MNFDLDVAAATFVLVYAATIAAAIGIRFLARRVEQRRHEDRLARAVVAIWTHVEEHTTYYPGEGYRWQTGEPACADPELHLRLAIEEGEAWHAYRETC